MAAEALIHGIPAGARPFVNLVQQADSVSLIPAAQLPAALKRLRSARVGPAPSVAERLQDPKLGKRQRKELLRVQRREQQLLLRREIEHDDELVFNPLDMPTPGTVAA